MSEKEQELYKRIGRNLQFLRRESGKTQEELSELLNKTQTIISKYESGTARMNLDTLQQISQLFSVSLGDLLEKELPQKKTMKDIGEQQVWMTVIERKCLSDKTFYLYYTNTGESRIVESHMIISEIPMNYRYVDFMFEDKENMEEQQLYEGRMVATTEHYFFYLSNDARNERGMFVTYRYPGKDKEAPFTLLGVLISLSHGKMRPCVQKCVLSSVSLTEQEAGLKRFLLLENGDERALNTDYVKFLSQENDRELYEWVKGLG